MPTTNQIIEDNADFIRQVEAMGSKARVAFVVIMITIMAAGAGIASVFVEIESLPPYLQYLGIAFLLATGFFVARVVIFRYFSK